MEGVELLPNEQFKRMDEIFGYYISNKGRCWSNKTKRFIGMIKKDGVYVQLSCGREKRTYPIHRLVMSYFGKSKPEGNYRIKHIDGDIRNNRIENLVWTSI